MQPEIKLTNETFLLLCAKMYLPNGNKTEDFIEDINRIKYIKKLVTKYIDGAELKERLILNHIIILNNVFPPNFVSHLLYLKIKINFDIVKPFLVMLNTLPDKLINVGDNDFVYTDTIPMNKQVIEKLRLINNR